MDEHIRGACEAIDRAAGPLPVEVIGRPLAGRWSIAQILEHLTLAFRANTRALEKAIASGTTRGRAPAIRQRLGRILVVDLGYFPRAEAPEGTRPLDSIPPAESLGAIRNALAGLDDALTRVEERFGPRALVANHPYFGGLTAPQWRKFHLRHTVHHMRQVDGLVKNSRLPPI